MAKFEHAEGGADKVVENFVTTHLLNPCFPEGRPDLHVGPVYLREARSMLEKLTRKAEKSEQDWKEIRILEDGIKQYTERFGSDE